MNQNSCDYKQSSNNGVLDYFTELLTAIWVDSEAAHLDSFLWIRLLNLPSNLIDYHMASCKSRIDVWVSLESTVYQLNYSTYHYTATPCPQLQRHTSLSTVGLTAWLSPASQSYHAICFELTLEAHPTPAPLHEIWKRCIQAQQVDLQCILQRQIESIHISTPNTFFSLKSTELLPIENLNKNYKQQHIDYAHC